MRTITVRCDACYGFGAKERTLLQDDGRFRTFKTPCPDCGGKGRFEYALFEIEEAKELLKLCEYMYCRMCENPQNRVICYGADITEVLRAIIVEQDCDLWMDKWTEYTGIVFALVKPYFELAAECRAQRESLAEEHKNQKRRRTSLIVFGTITCLIYILLFIAAFR